MRRFLVWTVLSASLVACSNDDGGKALEDAGDQADSHEGASVDRDADEPEQGDDGSAEAQPDGGAGGSLEAGAGRDAGTARDAGQDAGTRDAGSSASPEGGSAGSGCSGKAYKLCEDFESANAGALPTGWTAVSGWGTGGTTVADDDHHSGTKALKSAPGPNGQPRAGKSLSALGATANKHWGRIFYKVKSPATIPPAADPPDNDVIHNTLVGLKGSTESRVVDTVVNRDGKHQFLYNLPDDSCCTGSDYLYTSYDGKWHCAEWYVDASMQQFRFFYDNAEVKIGFNYGAASTKAHIGQYTQIIVGWINYQTPKMPYNQAWFDDLAIDDNRIGCD
jgi:hypothetical protein